MDPIANTSKVNEECSTTRALSSIIENKSPSFDTLDPHLNTIEKQPPPSPISQTTPTENSTSPLATEIHPGSPKNGSKGKQREVRQKPRKHQSMYDYLLTRDSRQHYNPYHRHRDSRPSNSRPNKPRPTSATSAHSTTQHTPSHSIHKPQRHSTNRAITISSKSVLDTFLQNQPPAPPRNSKSVKKIRSYDRFIPLRESMTLASSQFNMANTTNLADLDHDTRTYNKNVAPALGFKHNDRILHFTPAPPRVPPGRQRTAPLYTLNGRLMTSSSSQYNDVVLQQEEQEEPRRHIVKAPEKILDAPDMKDDFYLNVLDWSCQNIVAVGLDRSVYLWNADDGTVRSLKHTGDDVVTSLSWSDDGNYLALGIDSGDIQIWDTEANTKLRTMTGRQSHVGVLCWEKYTLASGAKDGSIWRHDVRVAKHKTAELVKHEDEVCGLKWSPDGMRLASGGNDSLVCVWDARKTTPNITKEIHRGAVKALAWCPWNHNILASGGGREDKRIYFWNTKSALTITGVDTGAQITSLRWSKHYKEIVSTHGFPSNHLSVWTYPKLRRIIDIPGHDSKILHSALSPDGQVLATAAADENLKFWRVFEHDGSRRLLLPKGQAELENLIRKATSLR